LVKTTLNGHLTRYGENRVVRFIEDARDSLRRKEAQMTTAESGLREDSELERVEAWRAEELERAGYDASSAAKLAARHDVDLHRAVDLLRQGCPPEIALGILL
jgi:hypothetical protein